MQPRHSMPSTMPPGQESGASPSLLEAGALDFETDRLPWQRSLRWVEPPRNRRRWVFGLLFALLVTVLELAGFAVGMRSYHMQPQVPNVSQVVQVILLEPETVTPPPPEPEPPAFVRRPTKIAITPPKVSSTPPPPHPVEPSDAMSGRLGSAGIPEQMPQLFNPDGSIRLGTSAATLPQAAKTQQEAGKARWAEIENRGNPVDCHKTRFAQAYMPDESVGDRISRKYLKWVGLADMQAIQHRNGQRAEAGGCDPWK